MAELYSARLSGASGFEKMLAIKRVRPDLQHDSQIVDLFLDEARVAALMNHPNIVQVYDLDTDGESYFLLMEYLRGHDLAALCSELLLRGESMSLADALRIVIDVARALHYAHEMCDATRRPLGIVHRDVCPRNVFITDHGRVKLFDFGVLKADTRLALTDTPTVKRTFPYMAPEQVELREVDCRADVFSLGVILWELTVGRRLFSRVTDYQIARRVLREPIPLPSSCVPAYPASLELVVMKALERNRIARYQTIAEMLGDLEKVVVWAGIDVEAVDLGVLVRRHDAAMEALLRASATVTELAEPTQPPPARPRRSQPLRAARMSGFLVVMLAAAATFTVSDAIVDVVGSAMAAR